MVNVVAASRPRLNPAGRATGRAPAIAPPGPDESRARTARFGARWFSLELAAFVVIAGVAAVCLAASQYFPRFGGEPDTAVVVERIVRAESNGNSKAKNPRSSATGVGQIIDQTWVENIQRHRQDLAAGRTREDLLALRADPALSREIVARMVEKNARMLKKRGLSVTPGSLYLAHFAGSAGAVAVLTGADDRDAASLLAAADATGRSTREQLVKANPFLATLTVGELKSWANRKMRG